MSTLAELQSLRTALTQELSRLREREIGQQRLVIQTTNELNENRRRAENRRGSASARAAARQRVIVVEAELADLTNSRAVVQGEIEQTAQQLAALDQQISLGQASPATLGPPGDAQPGNIVNTPAPQALFNQIPGPTAAQSSIRASTLEEMRRDLAVQQARQPPLVEQLNAILPRSQLLQQQIQQRQDIIAGLDGPLRQAPPGLRALAGSGSVGVQRARAVAQLSVLTDQLAAENNTQAGIETALQQVEQNIQDLQDAIAQQTATPEDDLQLTPDTLVVDQQAQVRTIAADRRNAQAQAQIAVQRGQDAQGDWRVKLRLAGDADYLYRAQEPGILAPLADSDGVIFPYMPNITTNYTANYSNYDLTHSNYRGYFYGNSFVSEVQIDATFTAQDTDEANYLLAVIHFFRSVTKMFYGQDSAEYRGAPPPLVFLQGLGEYQFNLAPCVVQNFNYMLPDDVDYVRARVANVDGTNLLVRRTQLRDADGAAYQIPRDRLLSIGVPVGGIARRPPPPTLGTQSPTYVPTQMKISLTLLPIQTRAQVSREFSLEQYANGSLIQRGFW